MGVDLQVRTKKLTTILRFVGLWFDNESVTFDLWYLIYSIIVNVWYNVSNVAQFIYICDHYNDVDILLSGGLLNLGEFITNPKAYSVIKHRNEILRIVKLAASHPPKNKAQEEMAKSTLKIVDLMVYAHIIGAAAASSVLSIYPLLENNGNKRLPFNAWYPYDETKSPYYELTFVQQSTSVLICAYMQSVLDALAANLVSVLVVQVDLLADNLRNISDDNMIADFEECLKHYNEILLCFDGLNRLLNMTMSGQLLMSAISLCLTLLELSALSITSARFIALLGYETALLTQLFIYSWWGNELMVKSQMIPQAAFESNWWKGTTSYKKTLLFFITRTQKPMLIFAVSFFTISLDFFILIIKNSYSCYAVLRHKNSLKVHN